MLAFLLATGLLLGGCGTVSANNAVAGDPYEATNRQIFDFNLMVDRTFLRPTATRYQTYVPEPARESIRGVLDTLHGPVVFANDVLQGEGRRAGQSAGRFLVNATIGLGGLFDVASRMGIDAHDEDFGQTLAVWGADGGPYLMLPLLGPSNPRDAAGKVADMALDPFAYIKFKRHWMWEGLRQYVNIVDTRARNLETFDAIERDSLDFYATARSLYRQNRAYQIRNGMPAVEEE